MIQWLRNNADQITWWVIGWLSFATLDCLAKQNWELAAVNAALIVFNYFLWKRNR